MSDEQNDGLIGCFGVVAQLAVRFDGSVGQASGSGVGGVAS